MNPTGMPDPTTQYAQLKSAVLGAQQAGGASPLGSFPELQKLYGDLGSLEPKSQAVAGDVYNTQVEVANQKAAEAAARAAQNDMLDPSKYQKVPLSDGGYKFLAPNGQSISAADYAHILGTDEDTVLKGSKNPIDISFMNDFKNLKVALTAIANKDTTTFDAINEASGNQLERYRNDLPGLAQRFMEAYPTIYEHPGAYSGNAGVQAGQSFIPSVNTGV